MAQATISSVGHLKDIPVLRQLTMLLGVAFAVALGFWAYSWSQEPGYTPLYSGVSDRDAADIADALRATDIPFKFDAGSGVVSVPQAQLDQARLQLASQGLPHSSGSVGFEMMQQDQGFGTSQFIENARYQHALETELARTVSALQPIRAARVHLAIPKPSAFASANGSPSASVLVDLHPGRVLEQSQVESIVHLVASSVANMPAGSVTVIDQFGRLLSEQGGDSAMARSAEQLEYTRRLESDYVRRIKELLQPMVGGERVSAQVTADVDYSVTEEARETYTPDPSKVRSEKVSEQMRTGGGGAGGIPGATSNEPPAASSNPPLNAASAEETRDMSRQSTRNYELDRVVSHTRQPVGKLRRLSVAVLVDHVPRPKAGGKASETELVPLTSEEIAKVDALVREAVGFDAQRGDSVSVQNAPFLKTEIPVIQPLPLWQQPEVLAMARHVGGIAVVLVLILFVLRPTLRTLMATPLRAAPVAALPGGEMAAAGALPQPVAAGGELPAPQLGQYEQRLQVARSAVAQDPKRVAQVVKTWIGKEGG